MKIHHFSFGLILFGTIVCATACQNNTPSVSAAPSVNPFDTTDMVSAGLADEDRAKLASASGKTVLPIHLDALQHRIDHSTGKLHIYCFWNLDSEASLATVKALKKVSDAFSPEKVKITFITLNNTKSLDEINLFIREQQLTDETLICESTTLAGISAALKRDISMLPAILMVNKSDETTFFYNKALDEQEIMAIVQPLTL